jgi:hypothetical protein
VKLKVAIRRIAIYRIGICSIAGLLLLASLPVFARDPQPDKKDQGKTQSKTIDSGSFGVFVNGQRVITENFSIAQEDAATSVIKAQLKEDSSSTVVQKSELHITSAGELVRYEWSQTSGGSITVFPNNDFLIEKITTSASAKAAEQSFLMPSTSLILDNNFFVHREILLWRYLASDCKTEGSDFKCQQGPVEFGTVVPQDRTSMSVRVQVVGKEKINFHGADRELLRLNLSGESFDWAVWVDDHNQFKLMRVSIPADKTEVVRD